MAPSLNDKLYTAKKASGPDSAHKTLNDLIAEANISGQRETVNDGLFDRNTAPGVRSSINDRLYYALKASGPDNTHKSLADLLYAANGVLP
jgi:hypothetical protein